MSTAPALPTRIIDVGVEPSDSVNIVLGSGKTDRYIALSYCWGVGLHRHKLSKSHAFRNGKLTISFDTLPKTILDAVSVVRGLGFRYLWVDALCIVQDDGIDWEMESARMAEVYGNAHCTLSATGASDTSEGLFMRRTALDVPTSPCTISIPRSRSAPAALTVSAATPTWKVSVVQAPINFRLWTLQERALSRRVLHWTKHELAWECLERRASETWPSGASKVGADHRLFDSTSGTEAPVSFSSLLDKARYTDYPDTSFLTEWRRIIVEASRRSVTQQTDTLPAISGLASIVHQHTRRQYLAGLWRHDPGSLFWEASRNQGKPSRRPTASHSYTAPSWSWASLIKSRVKFWEVSGPESKAKFAFRILKAEVQPLGLDPFGQVRSGSIEVSGGLSHPFVIRHLNSDLEEERCKGYDECAFFKILDGSVETRVAFEAIVSFDDVLTLDGEDLRQHDELEVIILRMNKFRFSANGRWHGIVLLPVRGRDNTYSRIGFVLSPGRAPELRASWDPSCWAAERTVTII